MIGFPLSHSLSPAMHNRALSVLGLEGGYLALETSEAELAGRMAQVRRQFLGVNVTVPHKENVIAFLDELSPEAQAIGAVNTVLNQQQRLTGFNTDAPGFLKGLEHAGVAVGGKRALVLGAGGAARAVVYALRQAGARAQVANRTRQRARELAGEFAVAVVEFGGEEFQEAVNSAEILVNATSVGLEDKNASPLPAGLLPEHAVVVDIVYNPPVTKLMEDAMRKGLAVVGGLPMLVWQGALAFEIWTGRKAPVEEMFSAAREALGE